MIVFSCGCEFVSALIGVMYMYSTGLKRNNGLEEGGLKLCGTVTT
jgi:hypothetical protein